MIFARSDSFSKLRQRGGNKSIPPYREEDNALFVPGTPLRQIVAVVDATLVPRAISDDRIKYLLGLLSDPLVKRWWYADDGPPNEVGSRPFPFGKSSYTPGWITVRWSEDEFRRGITYGTEDRAASAALHAQDNILAGITADQAPDSYASLPNPGAQMRADLIAAWAADAVHADVFVTDRDFLFKSRLAQNMRPLLLWPAEALSWVGLYLRQQDKFIVYKSFDGSMTVTYDRGSFYRSAAKGLLPSVWRWIRACSQHAQATGNDAPAYLVGSVVERLDRALRSRDRLLAVSCRPQDNEAADDLLGELDVILLLLMAAFDAAARIAHLALALSGSVRGAAWQRDGWLDKVESAHQVLADLVRNGNDGQHTLTIIAALRNSIHGEALQSMSLDAGSAPRDTRLRMPHQETQAILDAMRALGGQHIWGVEQNTPWEPDIQPVMFLEQLIPRAFRLLDALLTATPVERLQGVNLQPQDILPPADPNGASDALATKRIIWQLGL